VLLAARVAGQNSYIVLANANGQLSSASQTLGPGSLGTNWSTAEYRYIAGDFNGDGRSELYRQAISPSGSNSIVSFNTSGSASAVTTHSAPAVSSAFSYSSKTETTVYHDNLTLWVLGQVESSTTNDIESLHVTFNGNAQPSSKSEFGKLKASYTYWSNGLVKDVTDGNNNKTTAETYSRGVPTLIRFADNTTQSAAVNDNGWVTSVTNENGAKTCYGYDAMGRINSTTYPSESQNGVCNTSTWTAQSVAYAQLTTAELGMPVGTWRARMTQGRIQNTQYYDGLLRPVRRSMSLTTAMTSVSTRRRV
jgi:YD repeat-containing protein